MGEAKRRRSRLDPSLEERVKLLTKTWMSLYPVLPAEEAFVMTHDQGKVSVKKLPFLVHESQVERLVSDWRKDIVKLVGVEAAKDNPYGMVSLRNGATVLVSQDFIVDLHGKQNSYEKFIADYSKSDIAIQTGRVPVFTGNLSIEEGDGLFMRLRLVDASEIIHVEPTLFPAMTCFPGEWRHVTLKDGTRGLSPPDSTEREATVH